MVRPVGTAPTSPAWKAEILLLNDGRIKVAAGAATAAASPVLQTGAHLSMPSSVEKWRARPVLPRLGLARQASIDAVQTHALWWPARVTLPALPLKRRLHHCNACGPKVVLTDGIAPSSLDYQSSALLLSYARMVARRGNAPRSTG